MSIAVKIEDINEVSLVELRGRIVLGEESGVLREAVKNLLAAGKKNIVLDMAHVTYIDSAGLGVMVAANVSAKTEGASISLCALGPMFREVLQLTRLFTLFDVYETRAAAIKSFGQMAALKAVAGVQ